MTDMDDPILQGLADDVLAGLKAALDDPEDILGVGDSIRDDGSGGGPDGCRA